MSDLYRDSLAEHIMYWVPTHMTSLVFTDDEVHFAIYTAKGGDALEKLIMRGLNVNMSVSNGQSLLCHIVTWGSMWCHEALPRAKLLIQHRADAVTKVSIYNGQMKSLHDIATYDAMKSLLFKTAQDQMSSVL